MEVQVTAADIAAHKGIPTLQLFAAKADACAAVASEYVSRLPVAQVFEKQAQARYGAILLAVGLYDADSAAFSSEEVFGAVQSSAWGADVSRLLEIGWAQGPVIA